MTTAIIAEPIGTLLAQHDGITRWESVSDVISLILDHLTDSTRTTMDDSFAAAVLMLRTFADQDDNCVQDLWKIIKTALQSDNIRATTTILVSLLPVLRNRHNNIDNVFEVLMNSKSRLSFDLAVLCSISDMLTEKYLTNHYFWCQVQKGVDHDDNLSRKRALYLLKRALDTLHDNRVEKFETDLVCREMFSNQKKIWIEYFLILETIEEKQVHLVKQVYIYRFNAKICVSIILESGFWENRGLVENVRWLSLQ